MKYLYLALVLLLVTGCADKHQLVRPNTPSMKLDKEKSVYVAMPKDGFYGVKSYPGSAKSVLSATVKAFSTYSNNVQSGHEYQTFDAALSYAKSKHYSYLIFSKILHWEDRATEWSGKPDKVTLKVDIIDPRTNKVLDSVTINGTSGIATFGGDHPQDLLTEPLNEFAKSLY